MPTLRANNPPRPASEWSMEFHGAGSSRPLRTGRNLMRRMPVWALCAALTLAAATAAQAQGRRMGFGMSGLLAMTEVQTELKLEQAQIDKLMQFRQEQQEQARAA